ncbi:hypothetical protein FJT64_021351 [Amphibalanus amphitrite]|uniref:Uncharacterized protein n=1 Tax=Amphibalanus amphitrite TaxID=1232801 RepID=A0A6A4WY48_AMPAM|nr:hypothetical protein FJT64_021351 [Amphibalanus amphitrite]
MAGARLTISLLIGSEPVRVRAGSGLQRSQLTAAGVSPELTSESRPELTSESRPELSSESRPELTSESRPGLTSESRRRGQPERPHSLPDSVEKRAVAATPINPDGDILIGSESVQSERLRRPARPRGQGDRVGAQDEPDAPQPRVVTISPRVPVSDSIRSTTGRPLQLTDGGAEVPGQFPSGPANSAPFVNQAGNQNPFRGVSGSDPTFNSMFLSLVLHEFVTCFTSPAPSPPRLPLLPSPPPPSL